MTISDKADLSKLQIRRDKGSFEDGPAAGKSRILILVLVLLAAAVGGYFLLQKSADAGEVVELTSVSMISPAQASASLTASGYVVAQRQASIASKATGRLVYLGYEEGDKVTKGDIIARIESGDVEAGLAQAKAGLSVARAELNDAEQSLGRAKKLITSGSISQAEFDAVQARYDRVLASIESASASVKAADVQLENTLIRAPFSGTILTKNADVGEVVAPFAAGASSRVAVVTIADMSSLEVEADVSESNIDKISYKQTCEIILDAYPDKRYKGFVNKIVPTADRAKATVLTKIRFDDKDSRVLPEMSAKVYFVSASATPSTSSGAKIAVDARAVTARENVRVVFVLESGSVKMRTVEIGEAMGSMIEVRSGLRSGEKAILSPSERLIDGMKVKIKE
jgi:RND family efflux transporter MFP subunit